MRELLIKGHIVRFIAAMRPVFMLMELPRRDRPLRVPQPLSQLEVAVLTAF